MSGRAKKHMKPALQIKSEADFSAFFRLKKGRHGKDNAENQSQRKDDQPIRYFAVTHLLSSLFFLFFSRRIRVKRARLRRR